MDFLLAIQPFLRFACGVLTLIGLAVMVHNIRQFFRLVRDIDAESYVELRSQTLLATRACQVFMFLFLFGYVVGTLDLFLRDVEPIYMFVALMFTLGSFFVALIVKVQSEMFRRLSRKNVEMMDSYVRSIEMKDAYTEGHSRHVYDLVDLFWGYLPGAYRNRLNKPRLLDAALLHDIGKMSVADQILRKAGPLTDEEWLAIKTHTVNGRKMLAGTCFEVIGDWVMYHHERVDGQGYHGLSEDEIPLESLIIGIADTYSALATDRAYRARMGYSQIMFIMRAAAGTQLDPALTAIFTAIPQNKLEALAARFRH